MRLLIVMTVIFQNGIVAIPNQPPEILEQIKEFQQRIYRLENDSQKLMDENENFKRQIDGLITSKVVLYAEMEDKISSQNDKIASQNAVVAFRATCAKNFPSSYSTLKSEKQGKNFFIISSQNKVNLIKTKNSIQLFGKISNTISVLLSMHQMASLLVRMTEFIHFMRLHRFLVN